MSPEDIVLAGYSEACISVLLKHLDTSGVSKASLEEVVTSRLLLDPASVARLAGEDTGLRAAHHIQVILRAEVHWLLASQVICCKSFFSTSISVNLSLFPPVFNYKRGK